MSEMIFKSTSSARSQADTIEKASHGIRDYCDKLNELQAKLSACWEGSSEDLSSVYDGIGSLRYSADHITECLMDLAVGVSSFAQAIEDVAKGNSAAGITTDGGTTESAAQNNGFWARQKEEFANDWDYSQCDGVLDYVGQTCRGVLGTAGSVANFIADGVGEIFKWIF